MSREHQASSRLGWWGRIIALKYVATSKATPSAYPKICQMFASLTMFLSTPKARVLRSYWVRCASLLKIACAKQHGPSHSTILEHCITLTPAQVFSTDIVLESFAGELHPYFVRFYLHFPQFPGVKYGHMTRRVGDINLVLL